MFIAFGEKGYLLSNILKRLDVSNIKDNLCLFFMTPIDIKNEEDEIRYLNSQMVLDHAVELCQNYNLKLIYASSLAVEFEDSKYTEFKRRDETYIQCHLNKYAIFRIPRVYSPDRNKGLIYQLKNNQVPLKDYKNKVSFITLDEFILWFFNNINKLGMVRYNGLVHTLTIEQIKSIFCNFK